MFVSSAVLVLNTLISANVDGHFELFLQSKEEITLVGGLAKQPLQAPATVLAHIVLHPSTRGYPLRAW
jgi:hypothetical protein